MARPNVVIASAMLFLSSCSGSLQTVPDLARTERLTGALPGASYALPRLEYNLTVRQFLSSCPGLIGPDGKPTRLAFEIEVKAKSSYQPGERYLVDFSKLGGVARTGKFDIEWHTNGTLKSIGATADDKTGEIISDLTKTALSIWSVGAGRGPGASPPPPPLRPLAANELPVTHIVCTPEAAAAVGLMRSKLGDLKAAKAKADEIVKHTERAMSRAALRLLTRRDREALSRRFETLDQLEAQVRSTNAEVEKIKDRLGSKREVKWNGDYAQAFDEQRADLSIPPEDMERLRKLLVESTDRPGDGLLDDARGVRLAPDCYGKSASVTNCLTELTGLDSNFATDAPISRRCEEGVSEQCIQIVTAAAKAYTNAADRFADRGVFVRDPVVARLLVCRSAPTPCDIARDAAGIEPRYTPQFGQLRFIPFVVRPFEGRSLSMQLSDDGRVTKLSYSTDKAMLASIARTTADVAGQVDAARDKRETRRRADEDYWHKKSAQSAQDQIDQVNRELQLKEAQAKLNDPLAATKAETAQLQTEKALFEARRARIEAEAALAKIEMPSG